MYANTMQNLQDHLAGLGAMAWTIRCDGRLSAEALGEQLVATQERMESIEATANQENRSLNDVEQIEISGLSRQFDTLAAQHASARIADRRDSHFTSTGRRTIPDDVPRDGGASMRSLATARRGSRPVGDPRLFANLFGRDAIEDGGWDDMRDFFVAMARGQADPRFVAAAAGQGENIGQDGGFMVPTQFIANLLDTSLENEIVRPRARVVRATSNSISAAVFDDQDHSGSLVSGFKGEWVGEGESPAIQKAKIRSILMRVAKLMINASATSELLEDANQFASQFEVELIKAIGWNLDDAFLNGTGAGQPQGVLNAPSRITVAKEAGQAADTIVYRNIKNMFARLHPALHTSAVWVTNPESIPQLLELYASDGTSSTLIPVLRETDAGFRMLTKPVLLSEKMPRLGDEGDLLLADFSKYVIALRRDATVQSSMHTLFQSDEVAFRAILRAQGQDSWSKPFTPKNGPTLGWAVTLAERA